MLLAFFFRDQIIQLRRYGYIGAFLIEFISNASVLIPFPGSAVTAAMSPFFNPLLLALMAASGAALGELSAYIAGWSGNLLIENKTWYIRVRGWMEKYGGIIILLMAAIPNPLFDTAGLAAGSLRYPVFNFFLWCWCGKMLNRLVLVFGGAALLTRILPIL